MQILETVKSKGQAGINQLVTLGKAQPETVKTWGVTAGAAVAGGLVMRAGAAVAGGLVMRAGAPGLLAIFATLAHLPVSLTVGAIGGGVLGWLYLERQKAATMNATAAAASEPMSQVIAAAPTVPLELSSAELGNDEFGNEAFDNAELSTAFVSEPPISAVDMMVAVDSPEPLASLTIEVADPELLAVIADSAPDLASDSTSPTWADEPPLIAAESSLEHSPMLVDAPLAQQDNLEDIVGIGPVFATYLQSVGIYTFAQLAALRPEQIMAIMAPTRGGQMIDAADWIVQAGRLSAATPE